MNKTDAKKIAKEILIEKISIAYYCLENMQYDEYSEEEKMLIIQYINKYGETMAKSIGKKYFTQ